MRRPHILLVEGERERRSALACYLRKEGFQVSAAADEEAMYRALGLGDIDMVLLSIDLPDKDGLTLTRELRAQSDVGVMLIGAQQDDIEHIIGLELGADDYIARPFNERVLVARVKALLWRLGTGGRAGEQTGFKRFEDWQLDMTSHRLISPKGEDIPLTHGEFELLAHFVQNPGRVLTRDQLLNVVSSREPSPSDRTVDVLVSRLRHKIERDPKAPKIFVTVHGLGYRFSAKVEGRGTAVTTHGSRQ